jgi:hypothetical protein
MDDNELSDLFGELVASGDRTLSAGPLSTTPNTTLVRLENATRQDTDDDDKKEGMSD